MTWSRVFVMCMDGRLSGSNGLIMLRFVNLIFDIFRYKIVFLISLFLNVFCVIFSLSCLFPIYFSSLDKPIQDNDAAHQTDILAIIKNLHWAHNLPFILLFCVHNYMRYLIQILIKTPAFPPARLAPFAPLRPALRPLASVHAQANQHHFAHFLLALTVVSCSFLIHICYFYLWFSVLIYLFVSLHIYLPTIYLLLSIYLFVCLFTYLIICL